MLDRKDSLGDVKMEKMKNLESCQNGNCATSMSLATNLLVSKHVFPHKPRSPTNKFSMENT